MMLHTLCDFEQIGAALKERGLILVTAESCTAGAIAAGVATVPGSSAWLEGGFVVYSAQAKNKYLGVSFATIAQYDITSCEVAAEMACGALEKSVNANVAVAVTGLAGPGGGTDEIPVGTVCFAWSFKSPNGTINTITEKVLFQTVWARGDSDGRNDIRAQVVDYALNELLEHITEINARA